MNNCFSIIFRDEYQGLKNNGIKHKNTCRRNTSIRKKMKSRGNEAEWPSKRTWRQYLLGNVEKKRKKYGQSHKCCAAAKCNNRSDRRPDLSFYAFSKDLKTRKEWELRMRRGDVYSKIVYHHKVNFVARSISIQPNLKLVLQAKHGTLEKV